MTKKWLIRFYHNETAYKMGGPAFVETLTCARLFAVDWAERRLKHSRFKFYDLVEIQ